MVTAEEAMEKAEEAMRLAEENQSDLGDLEDRVSDLEDLCGRFPTGKGQKRRSLADRVIRLEDITRSSPQALVRGALEQDKREAGQNTLEGKPAARSEE